MRKTATPRELAKFLEKHGFVFTRQTGSHARYKHPDGRRTTVSMHNKGLKKKTLRAILKQTGLVKEFYS